MTDLNNYLDLRQFFINDLFGDYWLFIIVGVFLIVYACTKYQVSTHATLALVLFFLTVCLIAAYTELIWVFVVFVAGMGFYVMIARALRRG